MVKMFMNVAVRKRGGGVEKELLGSLPIHIIEASLE
jgi:hypothetical protein